MKNKTILITGGTTGIGLATARLLQSHGARVIVTGRNPETLKAAKAELGPDAVVLSSDAGSVKEALALGGLVKQHAAKLDGALLNAGIATFLPFEATTPEIYDKMYDVNVRGLYFQLQSILPLLGNPSSVALTASVVAKLGFANGTVYASTKAAVVSLGRSLAVELAPRGIRVNTISPGPIETPIFSKVGAPEHALGELKAELANSTLLKRMGTAEEVANLARFLLSDESSNIVGEDILVDGGRALKS